MTSIGLKKKKMYGRYSLSGVQKGTQGLPYGDIDFVKKDCFVSNFNIIVAGKNFGCGSSREHAPFSLREAGIKVVVAQSYSRLFFRNSVDGAFYPPIQSQESLTDKIATGDHLIIDISNKTLENKKEGKKYPLLPLGDIFDILEAGGIFEYAIRNGLAKK